MFCISFSQTVYSKARDLKNVTGNTTPKKRDELASSFSVFMGGLLTPYL